MPLHLTKTSKLGKYSLTGPQRYPATPIILPRFPDLGPINTHGLGPSHLRMTFSTKTLTDSRPHMVMITRTSLHIIIVFYSTTLMVYHLAKHLFTKSLLQLSLLTSIGLDLRKLILILQRNTFDTKLSLHYRIEHMASNLQVVFFPKVTLHTLET